MEHTHPQAGAARRRVLGRILAISPQTLGSYCALVLAALNVAFGVTYLLLPARIGDVLAVLFQAGSHAGWYHLFFGEWALIGLLGLAVVGPVTNLLAPRPNGWTDWTAKLAYLGFALTAIQGVHQFVNVPNLGDLYQGCGTCTANLADQQTIAKWIYVTLPLDPMNWLIVGAVALWILALSATAFGSANTPMAVIYLGIVTAVLYLAVVVAGSLDLPLDILIILATAVAAAWYAWVGLLIRRTG